MSIQNLYPNISPTLSLDFANTKALDPRITFARASTARFYDGRSTAKAEENLLLRSEEFENSYWTKVSGTTVSSNNAVAPDGTTTAETVTSGGTVFGCFVSNGVPIGTNTFSAFIKAGTISTVAMRIDSSGVGQEATFNLSTVTASTAAIGGGTGISSGGTATITDVGNGWFRCAMVNVQTTLVRVAFIGVPSGASVGQTFEVWGAQLEQRDAVTAYTPTTTQPITNYIPVLETAAAGVARFDHNPTTFESLGLLIEEQRTNLLTYSSDYSNAAWTKSESTITADTVVAPDGTLTADKLVGSSVNAQHYLRRTISISASTTYTYSFFAKAGEVTMLGIREAGLMGSGDGVTVDLLTNTVVGTGVTVSDVGNGWKKIAFVRTSGGAQGQWNLDILLNNGSTSTYAGDGYSGIYIWGAQLEAGAFPTSYIPTTTAQVTRSADAASMTGANFSSWYRADEGTFFQRSTTFSTAANSAAVGVSDNSTSNFISVSTRESQIRTLGVFQGTYATPGVPGLLANTFYQVALAYKTNDVYFATDGVEGPPDTTVNLPAVNQLRIGGLTATTANTIVSRIAYYPKRLANTQLQALTQN
jgi:hypothetical protein